MKTYSVKIVRRSSDQVEKVIGTGLSDRTATRIVQGVNINLNHTDFRVVVEEEK